MAWAGPGKSAGPGGSTSVGPTGAGPGECGAWPVHRMWDPQRLGHPRNGCPNCFYDTHMAACYWTARSVRPIRHKARVQYACQSDYLSLWDVGSDIPGCGSQTELDSCGSLALWQRLPQASRKRATHRASWISFRSQNGKPRSARAELSYVTVCLVGTHTDMRCYLISRGRAHV
jgi:hypothetical protein